METIIPAISVRKKPAAKLLSQRKTIEVRKWHIPEQWLNKPVAMFVSQGVGGIWALLYFSNEIELFWDTLDAMEGSTGYAADGLAKYLLSPADRALIDQFKAEHQHAGWGSDAERENRHTKQGE